MLKIIILRRLYHLVEIFIFRHKFYLVKSVDKVYDIFSLDLPQQFHAVRLVNKMVSDNHLAVNLF